MMIETGGGGIVRGVGHGIGGRRGATARGHGIGGGAMAGRDIVRGVVNTGDEKTDMTVRGTGTRTVSARPRGTAINVTGAGHHMTGTRDEGTE
jgi:hypothetical protein